MKKKEFNITHKIKKGCRLLYNSLYKLSTNPSDRLIVNASMIIRGQHLFPSNLGDDLNYFLLRELSHKKIINSNELVYQNVENLMCIGSIVEWLTNEKSTIWGSGAMFGGQYSMKTKPKKVLAVRGPLTRQYLLSQGVDCPEVYGDPALLLPYIYRPHITQTYKIGIIPHYIDQGNEHLHRLLSQSSAVSIRMINLKDYTHWHDVIDDICSCEFIISSSLHGLIIADAYGIPNIRVKFSDKILGGDFKYLDYFAAVHRQHVPPIIIDDSTELDRLLIHKENYRRIEFDANPLIQACPFPIHIQN